MGAQTPPKPASTSPLVEGYRSLDAHPERSALFAGQALSANSMSPPALRLLGLALRATGRSDEAADAEQRALKAAALDPLLLRAGRALVDNQLHDAEPLLKERLARDPFDYSAMRMLAEVAARIGRSNRTVYRYWDTAT
jgi:Flp pilus assembly protein TadD